MSSPNLPAGAFITSINGKRCTAVPRSANSGGGNTNTNANNAQQATTTSTTEEQRTTVASVAIETTSSFTSTTSTSSLEEENDTTSTTSSTSTSTSTSTSSTSTSSTSTSIVEAQETDLSPLPAAAASPDDSFPPVNVAETTTSVATSSLAQFSVIPTQAAPEASVIQTSKADTSITATSAISAAVGSSTDVPQAQSELTPSVADATPLFTTIGTAKSSSTAVAGGAAVGDSNTNTGTVNAVPSSNGRSAESTIAVAGGVIGGVAVISLIAFMVWFWRRRTIRKRRSTLLTPLSVDPTYGPGGEKAGYNIDRGSIGPTPRTEKLRAALGANLSKLRGRFSQMTTRSGASTPSVNMNRGNSQFMEPVSTHSRQNSSVLPGAPDNLTAKDRFMDWWSHLTADIGFKWKMRNPQSINSSNDPFSSRGMSEKKAPLANKPDFLTLLNMDDGELDREAQRRRASRMKGSGSSAEHFLGGLSLNFGDDPFSDSNAIAHQSAKPAPLAVSQGNNPFSDANAIPGPVVPKPSTYVADIRRSRGQSVSGPPPNSTDPRRSRGKSISGARPPSNTAGFGMYGRESTASVDSFATRRNKFRSDPFDLERPELLSRPNVPSSNVSTAGSSAPRFSDFDGSNSNSSSSRFSNGVGTSPAAAVRKPVPTHSRRESYSSKYSSGVSMGDWSDPGPDVGPAANRWDSSTRSSPTEGWRDEEEQAQSARTGTARRQSQGSQRSVGKAL